MTTIISLNNNLESMFFYACYSDYMNDDPTFFSSASLLPVGTTGTTGTRNKGIFFNQINSLNNGTRDFINDIAPFPTNFSVQWLGYFKSDYTGTWTFYTRSVDCSYMWIGNIAVSGFTTTNALIDNGGQHAVTEVSATTDLVSEKYYPVRIQYGKSSDATNNCAMRFSFSNPTLAKQSSGTGYFYNINNGVMRP